MLGGAPGSRRCTTRSQLLEVEENADRPDALLMRLPVNRTSAGDLQFVGDGSFEPEHERDAWSSLPTGQAAQCIFDGYVLSWRLHLDRTSGASTIEVWAQDASWLMSSRRHRARVGGHDRRRGRQPDLLSLRLHAGRGNTDDDSPPHDPELAQPVPARDRPAVPARPRAAQRQALPRRLHRHARRPHRLLRHAGRRRRRRRATITLVDRTRGASTRSSSTGT